MTTATDDLGAASQRLTTTTEALPDEEWAAPSLLPGWSRAHVVAHLALNAEAYAGALLGAVRGERVPMYASDQRRDDDIAALATATPAVLRRRLAAANAAIAEALATLADAPENAADTFVERTPGSARRFAAGEIGAMRVREIEVHHVDLGCAYSPADWPAGFTRALLGTAVTRLQASVDADLVATDIDWRHRLGDGGPTVSGPAHGLAWWLTGRPPYSGAEVTSDDGVLPGIEGL